MRVKLKRFHDDTLEEAGRATVMDYIMNVLSQETVDTVLSKRVGDFHQTYYLSHDLAVETIEKHNLEITPEQFEKAMLDRLVRAYGKQVSGKEVIPKFCPSKVFPYYNNHVKG
jgi:alanyl-tRNA synthetase